MYNSSTVATQTVYTLLFWDTLLYFEMGNVKRKKTVARYLFVLFLYTCRLLIHVESLPNFKTYLLKCYGPAISTELI